MRNNDEFSKNITYNISAFSKKDTSAVLIPFQL